MADKKPLFNLNTKNKFAIEKAEKESKQKAAADEAAKVLQTFVESFDDKPKYGGTGATWIRGGVEGAGGVAAAANAADKEYKMESKKPQAGSALSMFNDEEATEPTLPARGRGAAAQSESMLAPVSSATMGSSTEGAAAKRRREMDAFLEELKEKQERGGSSRAPGSVPTPLETDTTTNVYVGGLSQTTTEEVLARTFGRYGRISSVKVMWPRTEEERARGRNNGFVLFERRPDAEAAMDALQDASIEGCRITLSWAKGVRPTPNMASNAYVPSGGPMAPPAVPAALSAVVMPMAWQPPAAPSPPTQPMMMPPQMGMPPVGMPGMMQLPGMSMPLPMPGQGPLGPPPGMPQPMAMPQPPVSMPGMSVPMVMQPGGFPPMMPPPPVPPGFTGPGGVPIMQPSMPGSALPMPMFPPAPAPPQLVPMPHAGTVAPAGVGMPLASSPLPATPAEPVTTFDGPSKTVTVQGTKRVVPSCWDQKSPVVFSSVLDDYTVPVIPADATVIQVEAPADPRDRKLADLWAQYLMANGQAMEASLGTWYRVNRVLHGDAGSNSAAKGHAKDYDEGGTGGLGLGASSSEPSSRARAGSKGDANDGESDRLALPWLDDPDGPVATYLRWRVWSLSMGDDMRTWRTSPFQIMMRGAWWKPPSCPLPQVLDEEEAEDMAEMALDARDARDRDRNRRYEDTRRARGPRAPEVEEKGRLTMELQAEWGALLGLYTPPGGGPDALGGASGEDGQRSDHEDEDQADRDRYDYDEDQDDGGDDDDRFEAAQAQRGMAGGAQAGSNGESGRKRSRRGLSLTNGAVRTAMVFALDHADAAPAVVGILQRAICDPAAPAPLVVARLYVAADILAASSTATVRNASAYRSALQACLPDIFESLGSRLRHGMPGRMSREAIKERVLRVLAAWERSFVFPALYVTGLEATFLRPHEIAVPGGSAPDISANSNEPELAELQRRCKLSGLSTLGGETAMTARLAWVSDHVKAKMGLGGGAAGVGGISTNLAEELAALAKSAEVAAASSSASSPGAGDDGGLRPAGDEVAGGWSTAEDVVMSAEGRQTLAASKPEESQPQHQDVHMDGAPQQSTAQAHETLSPAGVAIAGQAGPVQPGLAPPAVVMPGAAMPKDPPPWWPPGMPWPPVASPMQPAGPVGQPAGMMMPPAGAPPGMPPFPSMPGFLFPPPRGFAPGTMPVLPGMPPRPMMPHGLPQGLPGSVSAGMQQPGVMVAAPRPFGNMPAVSMLMGLPRPGMPGVSMVMAGQGPVGSGPMGVAGLTQQYNPAAYQGPVAKSAPRPGSMWIAPSALSQTNAAAPVPQTAAAQAYGPGAGLAHAQEQQPAQQQSAADASSTAEYDPGAFRPSPTAAAAAVPSAGMPGAAPIGPAAPQLPSIRDLLAGAIAQAARRPA